MRTALVIVDMLNDFVDGALGNPAAAGLVGPIAALAERARGSGGLVVYANDAHLPGDIELRVFPPHAMAGTPGAQVVAGLTPAPEDRVVPKRFYSGFTETALDSLLRLEHVERVVLTGQHTDCCVRHTAYDAFRLGYEVWVSPEATTIFAPESDEAAELRQARALAYLARYYGARLEAVADAF